MRIVFGGGLEIVRYYNNRVPGMIGGRRGVAWRNRT